MSQYTQTSFIEHLLTLFDTSQDGKSRADNNVAEEIKYFLNQIPGGFFIYKASDTEEIFYGNQALLDIFGCQTVEEFKQHTGNTFRGMVHPDDLEEVEKSIWQQIASSQIDLDYVEYRIIRKDGSVRWIEDYGHYLRHPTLGDIFYVFITDATEKIEKSRAEKSRLLLQSEEKENKLQSIIKEYDNERQIVHKEQLRRLEVIEAISSNFETILHVDLDTDTVVPYRVSPRIADYFADGQNSFRGFIEEYVTTWVHPDDAYSIRGAFSEQNIRNTILDGKIIVNYRCLENGEMQRMQIRTVSADGTAAHVVIGVVDMEEELRHEYQQQHILEEALTNVKQASQAKDVFLSNMSHDLYTPLNAIFGNIKLARKNINDPTRLKQSIKHIENSAVTIRQSVDNILEFSNLSNPESNACEKECDLRTLIKDVVKSAQSYARRKGVTVIAECKAENVSVHADSKKIKTILAQFVSNAIKYGKKGGRAKLTLTEGERAPNGVVQYSFAVSDNGIGIGSQMLPHLFDAFVREHSTTEIGRFGAGLGLTIAKSYSDLLGGKIDVQSKVGEGSTFVFTLGLRQVEAEQQFDIEAILHEIRSQKILLVDDNEINVEIEKELLEEVGFSVESAENGQVALDMLSAHDENYYSVVLMDIQMPVMDGRQAAMEIRKHPNHKISRLPIIAVSANSFDEDKRLSIKAGMDAHLPKPLDIKELIETMLSVLQLRMLKAQLVQ